MGPTSKKTQVELLQEAILLEQANSEWTVAHAAAVCTVSGSFILRSDCPRIEKEGVRDIKAKPMIRFDPATVRAWNAGRTKKAQKVA